MVETFHIPTEALHETIDRVDGALAAPEQAEQNEARANAEAHAALQRMLLGVQLPGAAT